MARKRLPATWLEDQYHDQTNFTLPKLVTLKKQIKSYRIVVKKIQYIFPTNCICDVNPVFHQIRLIYSNNIAFSPIPRKTEQKSAEAAADWSLSKLIRMDDITSGTKEDLEVRAEIREVIRIESMIKHI